jgi:uncharacterized protein YeaO (DUF488 family)
MKKGPCEEPQTQARLRQARGGRRHARLVDRLWPRGVKKSEAGIDLWAKDLAPSTDLRKWFGHDPERWTEFKRRYTAELRQHTELLRIFAGWRGVAPLRSSTLRAIRSTMRR